MEGWVPFISITRNQRKCALLTIAADQDARPTETLRVWQQGSLMQLEIFLFKCHQLVAFQQAGSDLQSLFESLKAGFQVKQVKSKQMVFAFLPACAEAKGQPPT